MKQPRYISANYKDRYDGWELGPGPGNFTGDERFNSVATIETGKGIIMKGDEESRHIEAEDDKSLEVEREKVRDEKPYDKIIIKAVDNNNK